MPTVRELLQAIVERPDDVAPQLVYADWLDERGDPRGSFIRLQVEYERCEDDRRKRELEREKLEFLDDGRITTLEANCIELQEDDGLELAVAKLGVPLPCRENREASPTSPRLSDSGGDASVYAREGDFFIHGKKLADAGFLVACEPFFKVPEGNRRAVVEKLRYVLAFDTSGSKVGIQPLYELATTTGWDDFASSAILVLVEAEGETVRFLPYMIDRETANFLPIDSSIAVPTCDASALIAGLEEAIQVSRAHTN